MKKLKLSVLAISLMALGLGSCSKEACEPANELSNSSALREGDVLDEFGDKMSLVVSPNPAVLGDEITITGTKLSADPGVLSLQEKVNGSWVTLSGNPFIISAAALTDNGREFRAYFDKDSGNNFYSPSLTLTVNSNCEYALTPTTTSVSNVGNLYKFTTTYTISTCGRAINGIKLQGGLTSGATFVSEGSTAGADLKTNGKGANANTVISWNVGNMGTYASQSFTVVYTKVIACGSDATLTGAWSAKGKYADDNSPAVAGYNNQQSMSIDCGL